LSKGATPQNEMLKNAHSKNTKGAANCDPFMVVF